jgi:hypothetical protein
VVGQVGYIPPSSARDSASVPATKCLHHNGEELDPFSVTVTEVFGPAMDMVNGLQLSSLEECCHLTELENDLIAQNINFQYIFCLKKTRWAAILRNHICTITLSMKYLLEWFSAVLVRHRDLIFF